MWTHGRHTAQRHRQAGVAILPWLPPDSPHLHGPLTQGEHETPSVLTISWTCPSPKAAGTLAPDIPEGSLIWKWSCPSHSGWRQGNKWWWGYGEKKSYSEWLRRPITEISNGVSQMLKTELLHGPATAHLHTHPEKAKSIHHGETWVCILIAAAVNDKQDMEPGWSNR